MGKTGFKGNKNTNAQFDELEAPSSYVKYSRRSWLKLLWLLLLVPLIYILFQIAVIMLPRVRTEIAIRDSMTDYLSLDGFVALESITVTDSGTAGKDIYFTVDPGQRVSMGSVVARTFSGSASVADMIELKRIEEEIEILENAQSSVNEGGDVEAVLKQLQIGLNQYLSVLDSLEYSNIDDAKDSITLSANKLQIATGGASDFTARLDQLKSSRAAYETKVSASGEVNAPESGYFVPSNKQDRKHYNYEYLEQLSPSQLQNAINQPPEYYGDSVIGHIVTDYHWSYFANLTPKQAERIEPGDKLQIAFPEHAINPLPVVVKTVDVDEKSGIAKAEFACEYINPEILSLRDEPAQIIFRTEKGLRIDKNALRIIEGENCVFVKFGNQVYKRKIKILLEDENYMLIPLTPEKDVSEVEMYDDIIVDSGGVELHDKKIL